MFKRIISLILVIFHLVVFGPVKDVFAFTAQSTNYKLNSGALTQGGRDRAGVSTKLWQDAIGEPCVGGAQSTNYKLTSGFIPTIQSNAPSLTQSIPYQTWPLNSSKANAFNLDAYFSSPAGYSLTYTVSGNSKISVSIDPATHMVSFSQPQDWYGAEKVYFYATDTEGTITQSNKVVLQVANTNGPNKPVIVDMQLTPSVITEGSLVKLTVRARDLDNSNLTFAYNNFFTQTNIYKDGDYWVSEATWQTTSSSRGHYTIAVTVSDPTALTDSDSILVNVGNVNHPPVLQPISAITAKEGDLVTIAPVATDADGDAITFYYASPFDTTGKWLTDYSSAGTYNIEVTVFDGIDTVSQSVKVVINNTNRPPVATLTLDRYTVAPNGVISVNLSASDPDSDPMTFSIMADGVQIASGPITSTYTTTETFSVLGAHSISATVTDSGGLTATDTKGVDVADPNANINAINPVMGDFNGDALTDLGLHDSTTGIWEVCTSDSGIFRNAVTWLTGFGTSNDWWPIGGDFNGDGKTDVAIYNNQTGELQVALSNGSSFSPAGTWLTFPEASTSWQAFTGNFNGDKYTDIAFYNKDTGEVKVALGTGTGFGAPTTWITGFGTGYTAMAGDFNGDGLTDLCLFNKSTGEFKVAFSNGKAFVDGTSWISGYAVNNDAMISDFNNDGLADVGYWDKSSLNLYYAVSDGTKFIDKGVWQANIGASTDETATTGDFDGNGITDAATFNRSQLGINRWTTFVSTNSPADLLTGIDNGIGGMTQVTYSYAAKSDNSALPFPVYVASSISLVNNFPSDRAATYTQNFQFTGGYYDSSEREFRGFAKVRVTDPITNNYSETYFYQGTAGQDGALKGQIDKIISYDGNGLQISETDNTYDVKKAGPATSVLGFPSLKEQTTTVYEENNTFLTTKNTNTYDNIGNVLEAVNQGDVAKTGDEKSTQITYAQAYDIGFNRPLETTIKDANGNIVSKKDFGYDTKGNLLQETAWLNTQDAQPTTQYSYDSFGNLISTTNALGGTVTTDYETTFYAYPQKITNSLGQSVSYVYDPKFGVVTSVTDVNGATSSTTYDSFGRVTQVNNVLNQPVATCFYPDFNTKTTTNALGLFKTEYIDGLGRKYKTISSGEDGTSQRNISSEVYYNNRGLEDSESLAHYVDEDPAQISYVRYQYDLRGRVIKTISDFPGTSMDAQSSISYINPLYVEATDPMGHRKGTLKDVYGNIVEVTEFTQGGVYKTDYLYDTQNNLIKTTDAQGNITQIFYDSLGRKVKMIDPDMGTWIYEYDILGNLKKQTDAKNQVLEFTYDDINRLTEKLSNGQAIVTYSYDDATKQNCIGRFSKVNDQSGSTEFFYDTLGREIKSIKTVDSTPYTVERTYDILDRISSLKYPDGEIVNYTYNTNSGLLEKVQGASVYVKDTTYNAKGQIRTISLGNGTSTQYTYGQDLRLSRILTQGPSALQDLNYIFDKNGNINTLTDNLRNNIRTYSYDELNRLTQAQNVPAPGGGYTTYDYQYDSIGNMTYKSDIGVMTYGAGAGPHALTSANGYNYSYDANGNMTSGKNKTLAYDTENRIININQSGSATSFVYDGDGGRVKQSIRLTGQPDNRQTIYIGSLFEIDSSGKATKHIFAGSNKVCSVESTGNKYFIHSDHLGSSSVITDASGNQVSHYEYTPYGTVAQAEGADTVKYKFTGKELDSTGLYFYGARYYDPEIGRFVTADTIVQAPYDPQSLNRYSYCANNPLNYVDPTGHFFWFIAAIIGAIIGGAVGGISAAQAGGDIWKGILFGAVVGAFTGIVANAVGIALANSALATGASISPWEGAYITGLEFGIGGFGSGLASGYAGGEGSFSGMMKSAGMGFGIGLVTGAIAGSTYAAGWQDWVHGVDSQEINKLYQQGRAALQSGNFDVYCKTAQELQKMGMQPPGAVLQGKSPLGIVKHSYLVAAKGGQVKAMGFGPAPGFQLEASKVPVPGMVRTESAATLAVSKFSVRTWDLTKVTAVWGNMDKVKMPIYYLASKESNCYGWTNAVLKESGLPSVDARDVW